MFFLFRADRRIKGGAALNKTNIKIIYGFVII